VDQEWLLRVKNNAENLLEESKILFNHRRYKRSLFLLLTSLEEVEKIKMKTPGSKSSFSHKIKFLKLSKSVSTIGKSIVDNIPKVSQKLIGDFKTLDESSKELISSEISKFISGIVNEVCGSFDWNKFRNECLYEEKNPTREIESQTEESFKQIVLKMHSAQIQETAKLKLELGNVI